MRIGPVLLSLIILSLRTSHGQVPPTDVLQRDAKGQLPDIGRVRELDAAGAAVSWSAWYDAQRPPISKVELRRLIAAKRASLSSLLIEYETESSRRVDGGDLVVYARQSSTFRMKQDMLRFDQAHGPQKPLSRHVLQALDGDGNLRSVDWQDASPKNATGSRRALDSRKRFFELESPLAHAMLLNAKVEYGIELATIDLLVMLDDIGRVTERGAAGDPPHAIGIAYGGIGPPVFRAVLDPQRDYSVLLVEAFDKVPGARNQSDAIVSYRRTCTDLIEVAPGVWLPGLTTAEWFDAKAKDPAQRGRITGRNITRMKRATTSPDDEALSDEAFGEGIFPKGTLVFDEATQRPYVVGGVASVEATLDSGIARVKDASLSSAGAAASPTAAIPLGGEQKRGWLVAAVGLCLTVMAALFYARRRRASHA